MCFKQVLNCRSSIHSFVIDVGLYAVELNTLMLELLLLLLLMMMMMMMC